MTTGEGGLVTTEDDELASACARSAPTGSCGRASTRARPTAAWYYDMPALGFNYRITDFQCALGLSPARAARRVGRAPQRARRALPRAAVGGGARSSCRPRRATGSLHGYHLFVIRVRDGAELGSRCSSGLREAGIWRAGALHPGLSPAPLPRDARLSAGRVPGHRALLRRARSRCRSSRRWTTADVERVVSELARAAVSFRASFAIGGSTVGGGAPCYVIAEAGANHNRDLGLARELIDVAADAGADAVKFQTYSGTSLYSSKTPRFEYLKDDRSPQELLEAISLPREWQPKLAEHARERGIHFFSSPFDHEAVDQLAAARRAGDEDRLVRDRRPAADPQGGRGGRAADRLHRHGHLRRDRGCAGGGGGAGQPSGWRCCAARRSIPPRRRS